MLLELHHITIGQRVKDLSFSIADGQIVSLMGPAGVGKTLVLRTILGFVPVDEGHICIDGELVTPQSAHYFRQLTAYVPQQLVVPEGYDEVSTDYVRLLEHAIRSGRPLLIVDEPGQEVGDVAKEQIDRLLRDAVGQGRAVVAVNTRINANQIRL